MLAGEARAQDCTVSTVGVVFGIYDPLLAAPLDAAGSVTYRCRGLRGDFVFMDLSRGNAPTYFPRLMLDAGGSQLPYNLYLDAARTTVFGDGTGGTGRYGAFRPGGGTRVVPVYGRIPAGQDPTVGTYSDTIVATLIF